MRVSRARSTSCCKRAEGHYKKPVPKASVSGATTWASIVDFIAKSRDHRPSRIEAAEHLDQKRPTFRLLPTLVVGIGILVLLSAGSVLIVNWLADRRIVQEFTSRLIART